MTFVRICDDKILHLLSILEQRLPISAGLYNAVKLELRNASEHVKFYTHQGILNSSSFVVAVEYMNARDNESGVLLSLPTQNHISSIQEASHDFIFNSDDIIDWKKSILFGVDRGSSTPIVMQALFAHDLHRLTTIRPCQAFYMNPSEPLPLFSYKDNSVRLGPLNINDPSVVATTWKFRCAEGRTENYIERCIRNYPSCGLYLKSNSCDKDEQLASFVMCYGLGLAGMLGTKPEFTGKGYAKNVMQSMASEMKKIGLVPACTVEFTNTAALKVMQDTGFSKSHSFDWIYKY